MRRDGREGESGSGARNRRIRSPRRDVAEGKAVVARPSAPSRARVRRIPAAAEPPLRTHRHPSFPSAAPARVLWRGGRGGRARACAGQERVSRGARRDLFCRNARARTARGSAGGAGISSLPRFLRPLLSACSWQQKKFPHEPKPFPSRAASASRTGRQARRPAACTMAARKLAAPPRAAHSSKGPPPGMAPARCPGCAHGRCVRFA